MFKRMEIVEAINKGVAPSKITQRVEASRASFCRKQKGVGAALTSKPKKGRAGKRNKRDGVHPNDVTTGAKKTCLLH